VLLVSLTPQLFVPFADAVSLSQARRLAGFLPFAFAFAGGALVLARLLGPLAVVAAVAGAVVLDRTYPGNFEYGAVGHAPALATWVAVAGGAGALLFGALVGRWVLLERAGFWAAAAATAFLVPLAADSRWSPDPRDHPSPLTPGLVAELRAGVPAGDVVFSDPLTSYRISGAAPVYVASAPPGHVADTKDNRPYERRDDALRFLRDGDLAIPRRYQADWLLLDRERYDTRVPLQPVYEDGRYALYRLR
jgi:hypothetical protein